MGFINTPVQLSRRPERLAYHQDLQEGECLIELATGPEVDHALGQMVHALREYYPDEPPLCVVVYRAAEGTIDRLRRIDEVLFSDLSAMAIKTTEGTHRLPHPVVTKRPRPDRISGKRVLVVDGVIDTGDTLRTAIDDISTQADAVADRLPPPTEIKACVAVLKKGAQRYDVPELISCAMMASKDDWVVGVSNSKRGMDLDDRFAYELPGLYHIKLARDNETSFLTVS